MTLEKRLTKHKRFEGRKHDVEKDLENLGSVHDAPALYFRSDCVCKWFR